MRFLAGVLVGALLFTSCTRSESDPVADVVEVPRPSATPVTIDQGGRSEPGPGVDLVFETGRSERLLFRRAVRALVRIGVWGPLTDGVHTVELETHPGARSKDGIHLADAVPNYNIVDGKPRVVCDIRFYPRAMGEELRLLRRIRGVGISPRDWRDYNENGIFDEEVPTTFEFWASVLAHELSHCLLGPHGERRAREWEYRTMRRLTSRAASR